MEFNATIDLILKDLNDACQIIDDLKSYPGVPELQVELAKAKCRSARDVIALLKSMKQQPEIAEKEEPAAETVLKTEEAPARKPVEKIIIPEQTVVPVEKKTTVKQPKTRQVTEKAEIKEETTPVQEKSITTPSSSTIIADKFSNVPSSLNDQLGGRKHSEDVTEIIKSKPISSLKDAIGLNDRFLFQREIFKGDNEAYNQAINRLENAESEEDAKAVIISYTGTNEENDAVIQLMELVKRKLSPDE
jgi:hypothetical protein